MAEMAICNVCGDIEEFEPDEFGLSFYQAVGTCPFCRKPTYYRNGEATKITVIFKADNNTTQEANKGL
jgi:hypothetical protein